MRSVTSFTDKAVYVPLSCYRIITNAHCVADQSHVTVRKHGDPTKYSARVVAVGHECDLAVSDPGAPALPARVFFQQYLRLISSFWSV